MWGRCSCDQSTSRSKKPSCSSEPSAPGEDCSGAGFAGTKSFGCWSGSSSTGECKNEGGGAALREGENGYEEVADVVEVDVVVEAVSQVDSSSVDQGEYDAV